MSLRGSLLLDIILLIGIMYLLSAIKNKYESYTNLWDTDTAYLPVTFRPHLKM